MSNNMSNNCDLYGVTVTKDVNFSTCSTLKFGFARESVLHAIS